MKILIAGAGIMALSTAWRLAKKRATVHIFDPRPPGHGATLAALAALWPTSPLKNRPLDKLDRDSLSIFERFTQELAAETQLPVTYRRAGRIEILNSPKAAARAREESAAATASLSLIDYAAAQALNPGLAPFAHGALHCNITAQVRLAELVAALVKACQNAGVIFHRSAVTRITDAGFQTAAATLHGDAFVLAAGAWSSQLSPLVKNVATISPAKGQGIALKMPPSRPITTIVKSGPIYLLPWENEILVGATTEPEAAFDESPTPQAEQKLRAAAAAIIPQLAEMPTLRHWAGLRPRNSHKPHDPVMGPHPDCPRLFLCAGHYKTGIAMAPLVGELMSKAILEGTIPTAMAPFVPKKITGTRSPANP